MDYGRRDSNRRNRSFSVSPTAEGAARNSFRAGNRADYDGRRETSRDGTNASTSDNTGTGSGQSTKASRRPFKFCCNRSCVPCRRPFESKFNFGMARLSSVVPPSLKLWRGKQGRKVWLIAQQKGNCKSEKRSVY